MIDFLLLPIHIPFLQYALLMSVIIAIPSAIISCFLVLRGWSLLGDAVSHSVLPGIVLAYMTGMPLWLGAFGAGVVCMGLIGYVDQRSRLKRDTVMGVVFSSMFALGIVLYVKISSAVHLDHILFGNLLGIGVTDILQSLVLSALVVGFILLKSSDLLLSSFDENQAKVMGLPTVRLHYVFLMMISITIVATLQAMGLIMAIGLLIAPGAIAFLLTQRFRTMLLLAVIISVLCNVLGVYLSVYWDSAPAPTIILLMGFCFICVLLWRSFDQRRTPTEV